MEIVEKTRAALLPLFPEADRAQEPVAPVEGDEGGVEEKPREPGVMITDFNARGTHLDVLCTADQVVTVVEVLDQKAFFLESIAGVDWLKDEQLEVVYDFNRFDDQPCRVVVRVLLPRTEPVVPTISAVYPGANWHERETFDFYGIQFEGHPQLERLLLPEDADFHPLLKDYMP